MLANKKTYDPRKLVRMLRYAVSFIYSKGMRKEFEDYCRKRRGDEIKKQKESRKC